MIRKQDALDYHSQGRRGKIEVIATFLALLELIRLKEIVVKQSNVFGDIVIERNKELIQPIPKGQTDHHDAG